jgi:hypothetical protein
MFLAYRMSRLDAVPTPKAGPRLWDVKCEAA